jgi:surfeit locus 1 family protein
MRRFRPTLWPTLMAVPAFLVLLGLGTWQIERLKEKEALIQRLEQRLAEPPYERLPDDQDIEAIEYRRVRLTGEWLHARELFLHGRTFNNRAGAHVVTPFRTVDGAVALIDRGWVPLERQDPARRASGQIAGLTAVEAVIRRDRRKGYFQPDNEPDRGLWFFADVAAMAKAAGIDGARPYFLEALRTSVPGGFPVGGEISVALRNDHLHYAITWFSLALGLAVIYVLYHWKPGDAPG